MLDLTEAGLAVASPASNDEAGLARASLNAAFIPYRRALNRVISIPAGTYKEAVLCLNLIGNTPAANLQVALYAAAAEKEVWSLTPSLPKANWRTTSYREILYSCARSTMLGLLCEARLRTVLQRPIWSLFYEIPAAGITGGGSFCLSLRRLLKSPVFLTHASLRASGRDPMVYAEYSGPLAAYADCSSVTPGQVVRLGVHAPEGVFDVGVVRYGSPDQVLFAAAGVPGSPQQTPRAAYRLGAQWPVAYELRFDPLWKPGFYGIRLSDPTGGATTVPMVVRRARKKARLSVLVSTHTWVAYNDWGGASTYHWCGEDLLGRDRAAIVSRLRPNPKADPDRGETHLASGLAELVRWLEAANYDYELVTDQEVDDDPSILQGYRCIVLDSHAEYCTGALREKLEEFLTSGGNLIYPSGNALYWKTRSAGHQIEVVKPGGVFANGEAAGLWAELEAPTSMLTGVGYNTKGIGTRAPYRVLQPDHWAFAGTGAVVGTRIGEAGKFGGASGHETDKMDRHTPRGTVLLARGCNPHGGGAEMVYFERPDGGRVFSAGSMTFLGCLRYDDVIDRLMRNVFDRFLS